MDCVNYLLQHYLTQADWHQSEKVSIPKISLNTPELEVFGKVHRPGLPSLNLPHPSSPSLTLVCSGAQAAVGFE